MANIAYSDLAEMDLLEIWQYIGEDSVDAADRFIDYLDEKFHLLAASPQTGREYPELSEGLYGFPVKSYIVFHEIVKDGIVIARVLHAKRDIPSLFH